jgi:putative endonuclease
MFFVYVLKCSNTTLYVGYSENLEQRIKTHKEGKVISTRYRLSIKLIYYECFLNKKDAKSREIYLKSGGGRKQLKDILKNSL